MIMDIQFKPMNIVASATAILALVGGVIAFDSRYAKEDQVNDQLFAAKTEIINEMRSEVVKNRLVLIAGMQREADELEFKIQQYKDKGETPPRYMTDKYKQLIRKIAELKTNDNID